MIGIDIHLIHLREGSRSSIFFPQNTTSALSKKGKSTIDAPGNGRQSIDINASSMEGKNTFGTPSMKDKSADLPREGKEAEKTSISIQFSREKFGD